MKLSFCPYELSSTRRGALLRWDWDGHIGYSDLHPWPEFGDLPLEHHLNTPTTQLMQRAHYFAQLDSEGRAKGINLLKDKDIPKSHYLVTDLSQFQSAKGFTRIKVKVGRKSKSEIARLHEWIPILEEERLLLRLDFNLTQSHESFRAYMQQIELLHSFIEFIEDPFPFDEVAWQEEIEHGGIPLALDLGSERGIGKPKAAPVLIVKPAWQAEEPFFKVKEQKIVITSALDHPLGQVQAAFIATKFPNRVAGLLSHKLYPPNPFSAMIESDSNSFKIPEGTGFGFDSLLENLEWQNVRLGIL